MKKAVRHKGIIFNLDGTLIDSQREGFQRFLRVGASLGLSAPDDAVLTQVRKMWGVPAHVLVQTCWPDMLAHVFIDE